jgi:hypothetical protein
VLPIRTSAMQSTPRKDFQGESVIGLSWDCGTP